MDTKGFEAADRSRKVAQELLRENVLRSPSDVGPASIALTQHARSEVRLVLDVLEEAMRAEDGDDSMELAGTVYADIRALAAEHTKEDGE